MDIVTNVKEKYKADYSIRQNQRECRVQMMFGEGVSEELRDQVRNFSDKLGVKLDDCINPMELSSTGKDEYVLTVLNGTVLYRFKGSARFSGENRSIAYSQEDMAEAIAWTVFSVASGNGWLDSYRGQFIFFKTFSARQQNAAAKLIRSIDKQYRRAVPKGSVDDFCKEIEDVVSDILKQAPLFSARPIKEEAFLEFRRKRADVSLEELADKLYGTEPFIEELDSFLAYLKADEYYGRQVQNAKSSLSELADRIPMEALSTFFTELIERTDTGDEFSVRAINREMRKNVRFSMSRDGLKDSFREIDQLYLDYIRKRLYREIMQEVCDGVSSAVRREINAASKVLNDMRHSLMLFCYTDYLGQNENGEHEPSWRALAKNGSGAISSAAVSWDVRSLDNIQSIIKEFHSPSKWVCSEELRASAEEQQINDIHSTVFVSGTDTQCVWAIWARQVAE